MGGFLDWDEENWKGKTLKRNETRNILFQQQKFLILISFQWKIYLKNIYKINMRTGPIVLYKQAWLEDRLFGGGQPVIALSHG